MKDSDLYYLYSVPKRKNFCVPCIDSVYEWVFPLVSTLPVTASNVPLKVSELLKPNEALPSQEMVIEPASDAIASAGRVAKANCGDTFRSLLIVTVIVASVDS